MTNIRQLTIALCIASVMGCGGRSGLDPSQLIANAGGAAATGGGGVEIGGNAGLGTTIAGGTDPGSKPTTNRVAKSVEVGWGSSCAALTNGTVQCWGSNNSGQLGNGTMTDTSVPVAVAIIDNPIALKVGYHNGCAVLLGGVLQCWGYNTNRQMSPEFPPPGPIPGTYSNNILQNEPSPVVIPNVPNVATISVGANHICALLSDTSVLCWGLNQYGQLGNGSTKTGFVPVAALNIVNAVAITAGAEHSCALLNDGTVDCWGMNIGGQLGNGTFGKAVPFAIATPVAVTSLTSAVAVSAGEAHTCALVTDGTVLCWGENDQGQLGDGTTTTSAVPITVPGVTNATTIAAGSRHTCAILTDGSIRCWGRNQSGQLGNGTKTVTAPYRISTPVTVLNVTSAVAIASGDDHSCALLADGSIRCWGSNSNGQLGDGTTVDSAVPVMVSGF